MKFSRIELRDLAICWLALGFCFSLQYLIPSREIPYSKSLAQFAVYFGVALIGIGTGFLFHELAHKGVAQRFGYHAEFRMWKLGLIIAVASAVLSFGRFLFFAPGAVYTSTYKKPDRKEEGLISAAGPLTNIALAGLFYLLAAGTGYGDIWSLVGAFGFQVNLWLAAFNLIPFPPLDGVKILRWNKAAWLALAVISWGLLALLMLGVIK
jgi:Zn-dependent protease